MSECCIPRLSPVNGSINPTFASVNSINFKISQVSDKIYEALTQVIYNENFKLVRQAQSKENFGKYVMGPVISNINYNWNDNETLIVELQYMVESIDAENE